MKAPIIFNFIFFYYFFSAIGQQSYLNPSCKWKETKWAFSGTVQSTGEVEYFINGDTLLSSVPYYKLYKVGYDSGTILMQYPFLDTISGYAGSIREDSINKNFYVVFPGHTTEKLLYDFNLDLGDTVPSMHGTYGISDAVITKMDVIWFNGSYRKRWFMPNNYFYFIEGIGASSGLFGYLYSLYHDGSCLERYYYNQDSLKVNGCKVSNCVVTDTNYINTIIYDTNHVVINDTNYITIYDTSFISINDSNFIDVFVTDTNYITYIDTNHISVYDTLNVIVSDTVIINIFDTTYITVEDTLNIPLYLSMASGVSVNELFVRYQNGMLIVQLNEIGSFNLAIINQIGQTMYENSNFNYSNQISLHGYSQGIYYLTISDNQNILKSETRKLFVH